MNQKRMFETEDLPLFSGTAQKCTVETFDPKPAHRQESMAHCPLCLDTGKIGKIYCLCEMGTAAFHLDTGPKPTQNITYLQEATRETL